jgi:hypothetical protein
MANFGEVQSMTTEQALREQNQQLRKQLEYMKTQMQALMANLGNMNAQMLTLMETGARIEAMLGSSFDSAEGSKTSQKKDRGIQRIIINATGTTQFAHKAPDRGDHQLQNRQPAPAPHVHIQAPQQRQVKIQRRNNPPPQQYPPLPVSQAEIYKQLVAGGLLSPVPAKPWNPPFPAWYNPNAKCAYHSNVAGHSIENCVTLRQKIYELINAGSIELNLVKNESFKTKGQPKVNTVTPREGINSFWIEEEDQEMEQICWPGDQRKAVHITVTGDGTALPHI